MIRQFEEDETDLLAEVFEGLEEVAERVLNFEVRKEGYDQEKVKTVYDIRFDSNNIKIYINTRSTTDNTLLFYENLAEYHLDSEDKEVEFILLIKVLDYITKEKKDEKEERDMSFKALNQTLDFENLCYKIEHIIDQLSVQNVETSF